MQVHSQHCVSLSSPLGLVCQLHDLFHMTWRFYSLLPFELHSPVMCEPHSLMTSEFHCLDCPLSFCTSKAATGSSGRKRLCSIPHRGQRASNRNSGIIRTKWWWWKQHERLSNNKTYYMITTIYCQVCSNCYAIHCPICTHKHRKRLPLPFMNEKLSSLFNNSLNKMWFNNCWCYQILTSHVSPSDFSSCSTSCGSPTPTRKLSNSLPSYHDTVSPSGHKWHGHPSTLHVLKLDNAVWAWVRAPPPSLIHLVVFQSLSSSSEDSRSSMGSERGMEFLPNSC